MSEQTYYHLFGLPESASQDEIKRRYRELARKYHPDLNPGDPKASRTFADIATAYGVLSDPDARNVYDAELMMRRRIGRSTAPLRGAATATSRAHQQNPHAAQIESEKAATLARKCFYAGRFIEAKNFAIRSLSFHHKNSLAHEILGDIYMNEGRLDDAAKHFTFCLQFDKFNGGVHLKLDRLSKISTGKKQSQTRTEYTSRFTTKKQRNLMALVQVFGYGAALMILAFWFINDANDAPMGVDFIPSWSFYFLLMTIGLSLFIGSVQSISGGLRRVGDDFLLANGSVRGGFPAGPFLLILNVIFYPVGMLVHIVLCTVQQGFHQSLLVMYSTVTIATIMLAVFGHVDFLQTILIGGNVFFTGHFAGRILGDFFRND